MVDELAAASAAEISAESAALIRGRTRARLAARPHTRDVVRAVALEHGRAFARCSLRKISLDTSKVEQVMIPCGTTMAARRTAVRRVPIPPELVALLREHIDIHGTGPDGRLFRTYRGGIYQPSILWRVLQAARPLAYTPAQAASPLARKPYDFRHAGVSWRLNSGVPGPKVAEWGRAQHGDPLPGLCALPRRRGGPLV